MNQIITLILDNPIIPVVAVAILLATLFAAKHGRGELSRLKVRPRPLMTQAERRVCLMIEKALPGARIHAQVSMGALMNPAKHLDKSEWWTTFNKFSSKRVDFVAEDPATGNVIVLIELDDRSHNRRNDIDRDELTRHAGYKTVRLPAGERHTAASVAGHIERALCLPATPTITPTTNPRTA